MMEGLAVLRPREDMSTEEWAETLVRAIGRVGGAPADIVAHLAPGSAPLDSPRVQEVEDLGDGAPGSVPVGGFVDGF